MTAEASVGNYELSYTARRWRWLPFRVRETWHKQTTHAEALRMAKWLEEEGVEQVVLLRQIDLGAPTVS